MTELLYNPKITPEHLARKATVDIIISFHALGDERSVGLMEDQFIDPRFTAKFDGETLKLNDAKPPALLRRQAGSPLDFSTSWPCSSSVTRCAVGPPLKMPTRRSRNAPSMHSPAPRRTKTNLVPMIPSRYRSPTVMEIPSPGPMRGDRPTQRYSRSNKKRSVSGGAFNYKTFCELR
jgi:hypothetical protein